MENHLELRKWRAYSKVVIKVDTLTPELMALKQEQMEMIQRGGDVLVIEEDDMVKDPQPYEATEWTVVETESEGKAYEEFMASMNFPPDFGTQNDKKLDPEQEAFNEEKRKKYDYVAARIKKYEEALLLLKKKVTDGKIVIPMITKELELQLRFYHTLNEDPTLIINNVEYQDHPKFLRFNCIALRRIIEQNKLSCVDIRRLIGYVKIDKEVTNIIESFIHERKDAIEKDIVRERKRKAKLLDEKINRLQESNVLDPKIYEALVDEVEEECNLRPVDTNFDFAGQHKEYLKMLADYQLLYAMNEVQSLIKTYPLTNNIGENDFLTFRQLDIIPTLTLKIQEYNAISTEMKENTIFHNNDKIDELLKVCKIHNQLNQESLKNLEPIPSALQEDLQKTLEIFAKAGQ